MDKALFELLKKHLRVEMETSTDYDTYGSQTTLKVRLVWIEDGKDTEIDEASEWISSEKR